MSSRPRSAPAGGVRAVLLRRLEAAATQLAPLLNGTSHDGKDVHLVAVHYETFLERRSALWDALEALGAGRINRPEDRP